MSEAVVNEEFDQLVVTVSLSFNKRLESIQIILI